jgi:hypothetical protein
MKKYIGLRISWDMVVRLRNWWLRSPGNNNNNAAIVNNDGVVNNNGNNVNNDNNGVRPASFQLPETSPCVGRSVRETKELYSIPLSIAGKHRSAEIVTRMYNVMPFTYFGKVIQILMPSPPIA